MKFYIKHIVICILGLMLFSLPGAGLADSGGTDEMAYMLMDRVNNARADIRQALKAQGKSIDGLLKCRPEIKNYIDQGLPRVIPDSRLFTAAASHATDMANQLYFSKISKNGSTIDERFLEAGFYSSVSDEILGVVLFQNYMSKEKAVDILWKEILDNELNCGKQPLPILLNPEFREIGISVKSGSMRINKTKVNFYIAVCDFGADKVSFDEKEMFLLMNKARVVPEVLTRYLEPKTAYDEMGLAPYRFNIQMYRAAKQLIEKRMADILHDNDVDDPRSITERLSDLDYHARSAAEIVRIWISVDRKSPEATVDYLLRKLLNYESGLLNSSEKILLNSEFVDAGMAMVIQPVEFDGEKYFVHAIAMAAGVPEVPADTLACYGTLEDTQPDLQGVLIRIEGKDDIRECFTDRTGSFSVELLPGEYTLTSPGKEDLVPPTKFALLEQNIYVPIGFQENKLP